MRNQAPHHGRRVPDATWIDAALGRRSLGPWRRGVPAGCGGRGWVMGLAAGAALALGAAAVGQSPPAVPTEPSAAVFRRIYVPQDALETQIRGLVPLKRGQFEQRLSEAAGEHSRDQPPTAELVRVRLTARVDGPALREGIAELEVRGAGSQPATVVLEPWNLPLRSAVWKVPTVKPALVGRDPAGRLCCLVPHSGLVQLAWSQTAREVRDDEFRFELSLPPAPQRQIELAVPPGWSLAANSGLVRRQPPAGEGGEQRWMVELGGDSGVALVVRRPLGAVGRPQVWRESSRYTLYRGTLDLESTWQWEASAPLASGADIALRLPPGLRVAAVRWGEQAAAWALQPGANGSERRLVVSLPAEAEAGTLTVTASGDWPAEGTFVLPRIVPLEGVYQEGQVELFAEPWLQVQPKAARGGVRVAAGATAQAGLRGLDRFAMQLFEPDAQIELTASPAFAPLDIHSATQLLVEASQVLAVATAEVAVASGERFALEAQVPRPWVVDAVEVQPPEMLAERSVTAQGSGPQRLRLQLARPLVAGRPLRVTLRAHFRRPPAGQPLAEGFLQPLSFPDARSLHRWIAVQVEDTAAELRLDEDERLRRIEDKDLAPAQRQLFEQPPAGLVLFTTDPTATARATLEAATARYRAELLLRVEVGRRQVQHTLWLKCTPEGAALGSVLVRLVPPPRETVTWRLADDARELTALPEPTANPQASQPAEVWRVPLPRPRNSPFELTAQWTSPLVAAHDVPLVSLPDATLTTALVEVHCRDSRLTMQTRQMEPLPPMPPEPGQFSTLCGRFRYAAGQQPQLAIARSTPHPGDGRALVESLKLASRWTADGRGEHEAQLVVRSAGREELHLALPPQAEQPSWQILPSDASQTAHPYLPTPAALSGSGEVVIPLPPLEARATVLVRYRTAHRGLAHWPWRTWRVPLPILDLPVLNRTWTILLPSDLSLWSGQAAADSVHPAAAPPREAHGAAARTLPPSGTAPAANSNPRSIDALWTILAGPGWLAEACYALAALPAATRLPSEEGWQRWTLPLPDGPQAEVSVYRIPWAAAWAWAWACAAAAWGWRRSRFSTTSGMAFLALALATLSEPPQKWWILGVGVGALAGGLVALAWPCGRVSQQMGAERPSSADPQQIGASYRKSINAGFVFWIWPWLGCALGLSLSLGLGGLLISAGTLFGQEDIRRPPLWSVVVPMDDQGQPAGDYVYLDPGLYELLHRRPEGRASDRPPWLVVKARYELELPTLADASGESALWAVPRLRAVVELETFQPDTRVVLPWRQEEVTLHPGQSRLDGQPATLIWEPDGRGLAVTIREPGRHQLAMMLATRARRVGEAVQLELFVPPAAIEEWGEFSDGSQGHTAIGASAQQLSGRVSFFSLGPGRVRWQWPADLAQAAPAQVEAEQLLWWKIRRGSVSLEARFRVRGLRPGLRTLSVEVDPRLRLVSGLSQGPIRRVHSDPAAARWVQVECEVPASGELAWQMVWLWPQASGIGRLQLPRVRLDETRLVRDWTAVSVEPSLEWVRPVAPGKEASAAPPSVSARPAAAQEPASHAGSDPGSTPPRPGLPAPAAFLAAWGEQETPPLAVFATLARELQQPLVIRPALGSPSADVELDWSVGTAAAKLTLLARVQGAAGRFEYRLTWPAPLRVQRVAWQQGGRAAAIRWTQPADGTLLLTLLEPPAGEAELQIEATLALPAQRTRLVLPLVRLDDVRTAEMRVRLYRQREVLLELPAAAGWEAVAEGPAGSFRSERGWLVGAVRRVDERARPLQVERKSHRPKLAGNLLVRVRPEADGWQAQALVDLEVQDGFLDDLRLSVPAAFSEQLRLDPAWETRLEPTAVPSRRLWIVRPPVSLTGKVQLVLQGRLDPAAGGMVVPDISLPSAPQVARWVLLEPGTPEEPIVWQPRGLVAVRPQEVPAAAAAWQPSPGQWFRVVGRRFEVTGRLRQQTDAAPRCLLAEYTVAPVSARHWVTRATFTILPADTRPLVLALPPGQRLLQVLVEGVAATPLALGPRRWQVAAPSDVLPYQLTILADGQEPITKRPAAGWTWPLPGLVDLPAAQWLITVRGALAAAPSGAAHGPVAVESARPCSSDEAALVQIETLARCLEEVSTAQSRDLPGGMVSQSVQRWRTPLERALAARAATPSEDGADMQARLAAVQQLVAAIKARRGLADTAREEAATGQRPAAASATQSWALGSLDADGAGLADADDPAVSTFRLHSESPPASPPVLVLSAAAERSFPSTVWPQDEHGMLTALLLGAALAAWGLALWPRAAVWLAWHQPLALVLASVTWWLAAPWGWLGWLGVMAAGWRAWRQRGTGIRPEPFSAGSRNTGLSRRARG